MRKPIRPTPYTTTCDEDACGWHVLLVGNGHQEGEKLHVPTAEEARRATVSRSQAAEALAYALREAETVEGRYGRAVLVDALREAVDA